MITLASVPVNSPEINGLVFFAGRGDFALAGLWLIGLPLALAACIRVFPSISRYIGYGRVEDRLPVNASRAGAKVTLYSAIGCPFCPLVKRRLLTLRQEMAFELEEVDVTAKPSVLIAKGISAVPVVEVGQSRLAGHAISEQLAKLISGSASASL